MVPKFWQYLAVYAAPDGIVVPKKTRNAKNKQ
jgi:hypothetical protein